MLRPNGWLRLGALLSVVWLSAVCLLAWFPAALPSLGGWLYPCERESDPLCLFEKLSYSRVSTLVFGPVAAMWLLGWGVAWVRRGFGDG